MVEDGVDWRIMVGDGGDGRSWWKMGGGGWKIIVEDGGVGGWKIMVEDGGGGMEDHGGRWSED